MIPGTSFWRRSKIYHDLDTTQVVHGTEVPAQRLRSPPSMTSVSQSGPSRSPTGDLHFATRSTSAGSGSTAQSSGWRGSRRSVPPPSDGLTRSTTLNIVKSTPAPLVESSVVASAAERPHPPRRNTSSPNSRRYSLNSQTFSSTGSTYQFPSPPHTLARSTTTHLSSSPSKKRSSLSISLQPLTDIFSSHHRRRPSLQASSTSNMSSMSRPNSAAVKSRSRASSGTATNSDSRSRTNPTTNLPSTSETQTYNSGNSSRDVVIRAFDRPFTGQASRDGPQPPKEAPVDSPVDPQFVGRQIMSTKSIATHMEDEEERDGGQRSDRRNRSTTFTSTRSGQTTLSRKSSASRKLREREEENDAASGSGNSTAGKRRPGHRPGRNEVAEEYSDDDSSVTSSAISTRRPSQISLSSQHQRPDAQVSPSSHSQRKGTTQLTSRPLSRTRDKESLSSRPPASSSRLQPLDGPSDSSSSTPTPASTAARISSISGPAPPNEPNALRYNHRSVSSTTVNTVGGRSESQGPSGSGQRSRSVALAATHRMKTVRPTETKEPKPPPKIDPAPPSGMYWHKVKTYGVDRPPLRAHTCTIVGGLVYIFGGSDHDTCFNDLYIFDPESLTTVKPVTTGTIPPPLRAMTCTALPNRRLLIFGGGDGPSFYNNDLYLLDTTTLRFTKPKLSNTKEIPSRRRAHTASLYKNGVYIFGGGDGQQALNDVWRLEVGDVHNMSWKCLSKATGIEDKTKPTARGYHSANMVGSKLIIFGGSDGVTCFDDVWVLDVDTGVWKQVSNPGSGPGIPPELQSVRRLSHSSTLVGSYLFIIGGHNGKDYSCEVVLLNLVTMKWDKRKVYGAAPSGRGYHGAVLHDSRIFIIGGFDAHTVFGETYVLELAASSYYHQISHFSIELEQIASGP